MTLILAIGCDDGVVIASDSAVTDLEVGTKHPSEKIKQLSDHPIFYGTSGDVGLTQKVDDALALYKPKTQFKQIRTGLKSLIVPVLKTAMSSYVPYPKHPYNIPPAAVFLFVGVLDGEPWILEIERNGTDTLYGEGFGHFAAIGSGKLLAHALFRSHLMGSRDLKTGKVQACRVVEDSIQLAASGIALPVHIYTISADGHPAKLEDSEMRSLSETCGLWRVKERESLGSALTPSGPTPENAEIPKPKQQTSSQ